MTRSVVSAYPNAPQGAGNQTIDTMNRKVIIAICLFLIITNVPPVRIFLDIFLSPAYHYATRSMAFQDEEIHYAGGKYEDVIRAYNRYATSFNASDDTLFRTFEMKPYKFWLWGQYLLHPKYRLPYLEVTEGSIQDR